MVPQALCFTLYVCACACPLVCDVVSAISMVCIDVFSPHTFVISAYWDKDELISFCGEKAKSQGQGLTKRAKNTRENQLFVFSVCCEKRSCPSLILFWFGQGFVL